jgi:murein DD-endopeptidase MepM/ murein hydrolase activator NlpD
MPAPVTDRYNGRFRLPSGVFVLIPPMHQPAVNFTANQAAKARLSQPSRFRQMLSQTRHTLAMAGVHLLGWAIHAVSSLGFDVADWLREDRRRAWALVATGLTGSAMTALAVATADLQTNALPQVTTIDAPLALPQLDAQIQALEARSLRLYSSTTTRSADTAEALLRRLGVNDPAAASFIRQDDTVREALAGRAAKMVQATTDNGRLMSLVVRAPAKQEEQLDTYFTRIHVERVSAANASGRFMASAELVPLEVHEQMATATIRSSLFAAADDANIPDVITNQLAEIFGTDIDFRRELRQGDAFTVVYEAHTADGEPITWGGSAGRVLAARFINKDKVLDAVWFQEPGRKGAFFDLNGRGKNKAFLASPLAFSRITSGFAMRFHPILNRWKAHLGVDYGAPTGTPVRVVGDGTVKFAGWQNGYGNVVEIQHTQNRITKYAHLSRIDVRTGEKVEQGQTVAAVGATGWATGPHLHFEFLVNGEHQDPMIIARASEGSSISEEAVARYRVLAQQMAERFDAASQMQTAGASTGPRFE